MSRHRPDYGIIAFYSFASAAAGAVMAMCVTSFILRLYGGETADILRSSLVGAIDGALCCGVFIITSRKTRGRTLRAFLAVALVIALITTLGAYLMGMRPLRQFIVLIAIAEAAGLIVCWIGYRTSCRLEEHLRQTQERYRD